jgi:S-adenosylmethionine-dependent methyltransferase
VAQLGTDRFQKSERYAAYLRTTEGKLRVDLGWTNLRGFLPVSDVRGRALDIGGGTGVFTLRLAAFGFDVVLLDNSEAMLAQARKEANAEALSSRISFSHGEANSLCGLFEPCSFDAVVCHNLLEYMEDPFAVLCSLTRLLKKDGKSVVSLLVRNRYGEVLKSAIKGRNLELAKAALLAETVLDPLYGQPVRVFDPLDFRRIVERAGLKPLAERGVRVLSDYLCCEASSEDDYARLLNFELLVGAQPQFAAVARYTQVIARPEPNQP